MGRHPTERWWRPFALAAAGRKSRRHGGHFQTGPGRSAPEQRSRERGPTVGLPSFTQDNLHAKYIFPCPAPHRDGAELCDAEGGVECSPRGTRFSPLVSCLSTMQDSAWSSWAEG